MQMRYVPSARDLRVHGLHGQASVAPSRRAAKRSESFAAVGALFSVAMLAPMIALAPFNFQTGAWEPADHVSRSMERESRRLMESQSHFTRLPNVLSVAAAEESCDPVFIDFYADGTSALPIGQQLAPAGSESAPVASAPAAAASTSQQSASSGSSGTQLSGVRCSRCGQRSTSWRGHDKHTTRVENQGCRGALPIPESQYQVVAEARRVEELAEKERQLDYAEQVEDNHVSQPATHHARGNRHLN